MSTGLPGISVLVANFNGTDVIRRCLDSVLEQEVDAEVEVIVYDDASTDDSADIVAVDYPSVTLVRGATNAGFCVANNRMVEQCGGDYLLLLNNDAWLEPGALGALLAAGSEPTSAVLTLPQRDADSGVLLDAGMGLDLFATPYPLTPETPLRRDVPTVMGACLWLPRNLWQDIGGFPEWFESIGEDLYLCQHARILGAPVQVLGGPCYHHHVGHSFGGGKVVDDRLSTSLRRRRLSERNVLFVMAICYPWPALLPLLPLKLLLLLVEGAALALVRRQWRLFADIYWYALSELFGQRRRVLEARRTVQSRRQLSTAEYLRGFDLAPYKLRMLLRHGFPEVR